MKLSLLKEWAYAEGRDKELFGILSQIKFEILAPGNLPVASFRELVEELKSWSADLIIDPDGTEQEQAEMKGEITQHISSGLRVDNRLDAHKWITALTKLLADFMR